MSTISTWGRLKSQHLKVSQCHEFLFLIFIWGWQGYFLPATNSASVFRSFGFLDFWGSVSMQYLSLFCTFVLCCHVCVRLARIVEEEVLNVKSWSMADNVLWKGKVQLDKSEVSKLAPSFTICWKPTSFCFLKTS